MTDIERERRILELLSEAVELEGDDRRRFLDVAAAEDPETREELESMLGQDSRTDFLEVPAAVDLAGAEAVLPATSDAPEIMAGDYVGPYRIQGLLGRGGMAAVYHAVQEKPVRRRVALKVVEGIQDVPARRRFATECQALARLDHPNLAAMYEVGDTESGKPFVAMEPVDGGRITTWCDEHRLSLRERIEIFIGACAGVRHAHEKGILHRDIKPSNVLVKDIDGQPVAKVIDFGIARAYDESLSGETPITSDQQIVGSPAFMSPEAVSRKREEDTRSDVYSLGLLLYWVLAGVAPFEIEDQSPVALLRRHAEGGFPPPSRRFVELAIERQERIAGRRGLTPRGLTRTLEGPLDAVVMKAIALRPEDRYGSPADLAADLDRHLRHVPVSAMARKASYRTQLFLRRHRTSVAAAALVVLALLLGFVTTSMALVRTRQAEARAVENFSQARLAVDDFLISVSENDLLDAPGAQPLRRQLLERALAYYQGFIENHEDDESVLFDLAQAYVRVGRINDDLGTHQHALPAYEKATSILGELVAADPDSGEYRYHLADATHRSAWAYYENGDFNKAFAVGIEAVEMEESLVADFPHEARYRELLAKGLADRSEALEVIGQDEAAVANAQRAVEILEGLESESAASDRYAAKLARAYTRVGTFLYRVDRFEEAVETHNAALAIYRRLLRENPADRTHRAHYAESLSHLGSARLRLGQTVPARRAFEEALAFWNDLRDEYPSMQDYQYHRSLELKNLGKIHRTQGDFNGAAEWFERSLESMRRLRAKNPTSLSYRLQTGHQLRELGEIHSLAGRSSEAIAISREAADLLEDYVTRNPSVEDAKHSLSRALGTLAANLYDEERLVEALRAKESQLAILEVTGGDERFEAILSAERRQAEEELARWRRRAGAAID